MSGLLLSRCLCVHINVFLNTYLLGCIVYEMACLQKTFEGSNLPALVNKIMRGQFEPIRGNYSPLFKKLGN